MQQKSLASLARLPIILSMLHCNMHPKSIGEQRG
jgi:hypothetical protein